MISGIQPVEKHFIDGNGNPFFWLGDTLWELFRRFEPEEARSILNTRKEQGFNVALVMLTGVDTSQLSDAVGDPFVNIQDDVPWFDNDPLKPNEAYFRHIDDMMELATSTGMILVVGIYHQWLFDTIPEAKAREWGRWVGERYRNTHNLIWSMYPRATKEYEPVCRELAAGLAEGDHGNHLISIHPDPAVASSSFMHSEPWLAFNMIQTCIDYDQIPEAVASDYRLTPAKPVIMAEGGYEGLEFGHVQTAHDIRKQAYWSQLSGGYFVYGHNESWITPRKTERWLHAPGVSYMRTIKEIVTSLPGWWKLIPDNTLIEGDAGKGMTMSCAARSANDDWIAVYFSEPSTRRLNLSSLARGATRARWIDPRNGNSTTAGTPTAGAPTAGAPSHQRTYTSPADWEDALLLIS